MIILEGKSGKIVEDELFAWVAEGEGIVAFIAGQLAMPAVSPDYKKMELMRPQMEELSKKFKKRIYLAKFSGREDLQTIEP
jgi:hypothetical protein